MQNQPKIKVCGLTKIAQIQQLIEFKIDFLGFIFYKKSPRYVLNHLSFEEISNIPHNGKVGVFVNENIEKIVEISEKARLTFIQLHGDENENFISELRQKLNPKTEIIKVIRIGKQNSIELQNTIDHQQSSINYLLFDTDSKSFGGTGKTFDWNMLNEIEIPIPYFLSGGISLENIEEENRLTSRPFAFDINSKFEIEAGNKDLEKIRTLINLLKGLN